MSKGLEALENICNQCEFYQFEKGLRPKKCPFNKSCVYKEQIKKELKAFEIIKEKKVNVNRVKQIIAKGLPWHTYNLIQDANRHLDEEEFDILKEVML